MWFDSHPFCEASPAAHACPPGLTPGPGKQSFSMISGCAVARVESLAAGQLKKNMMCWNMIKICRPEPDYDKNMSARTRLRYHCASSDIGALGPHVFGRVCGLNAYNVINGPRRVPGSVDCVCDARAKSVPSGTCMRVTMGAGHHTVAASSSVLLVVLS